MEEGGKASSRSGGHSVDEPAAKRVQKADRERLRRDRLNEQFIELAGVLGGPTSRNPLERLSAQDAAEIKIESGHGSLHILTFHSLCLCESSSCDSPPTVVRSLDSGGIPFCGVFLVIFSYRPSILIMTTLDNFVMCERCYTLLYSLLMPLLNFAIYWFSHSSLQPPVPAAVPRSIWNDPDWLA